MGTDAVRYYTLGELWPNMGFVGMLTNWKSAFFQAMGSAPEQRQPECSDDQTCLWWVDKCRRWQERGPDPDWDNVRRAVGNLLPGGWGYHGLTVSNVGINFEADPPFEIRDCQPTFSWTWHGFSRGWVWALLYHLTNEQMADVERVWSEIIRDASLYHVLAMPGRPWSYEQHYLMVALYERVLGLMYDQQYDLAHYLANIVKRKGMSARECEQRMRLFHRLVVDLHMRVVDAILNPA